MMRWSPPKHAQTMKEHLPLALILVMVGIGWLMLGLRALTRLIRSKEEMERYGLDGHQLGALSSMPAHDWSKLSGPQRSDIRKHGIMGPAVFFGIVIYVIAYHGLTS